MYSVGRFRCLLLFVSLVVLCVLFYTQGGDKLTLSLSGTDVDNLEALDGTKEGRSATPVTVTHFSWGEAGKLEQRVVSPSSPPPTPFMSLSVTPHDSAVSTNPFVVQASPDPKTTTNPFLVYPNSNPFVDLNTELSKNLEIVKEVNLLTTESHININLKAPTSPVAKVPPTPIEPSPVMTSPQSDKVVEPATRVSVH